MKTKKAAIELSIGTVVIIVLAMSMLILGLVLIRNIFGGATDSVDALNDGVRSEITSLFAEESSKIAIKLGAGKLAKIPQGTQGFGIAFGARTDNGEAVSNTNLRYKLEKTNENDRNCEGIQILDHTFVGNSVGPYQFEDTEADNGFVVLVFNIREDAPECTQRYRLTTIGEGGEQIAQASFRVQIETGGIFS